MATYTSSTNPNDCDLYEHRAKKIYLTWCSQIVDIIEGLNVVDTWSLNDIGCNYGQVHKEIKKRNTHDRFDYVGYDVDKVFLEMAQRHFPEMKERFVELDIETQTPRVGDITICSEVLEHLDNPRTALENMLKTTSKCMILRTFVGPNAIEFIQDNEELVASEYK